MSQISHIKYKDIIEAGRFDADYFKPKFLQLESLLKKKHSNSLGEVSKIFRNPMMYGFSYVEGDGIPYIRIDDLCNPFIDLESCVKISDETNQMYKSTQLKYGDIIMGVRGNTIGRLGIYKGEDYKGNMSPNTIFFRLNNSKLSNVTTCFLLSKYGMDQIERMLNGTGQPTITSLLLKDLIVPNFEDNIIEEIDKLFENMYLSSNKSKQLYQEAEELLLTELGLKNHKIFHALTFSTTKKEVDEAGRYDADYFQPKYDELIEKIENYKGGWDYVENLFKQNLSVAKTDSETCNYVEIGDINISNGEIIPNEIFVSDLPANGKRILKKNDLLISKVRPYRGAVSYIDFDCENLIGSGAFTILQEKSGYKKEVLMVFLKTECIKDLLLRYNCGTSYPVIKDDTILKLKLPLINPQLQKEISDKIKESFKLRNESKELLEQAKKMVEDEIEKE